ncbi:hypothetical protein MNBD_NITROSPINAE01-1149 [hydrothermal vent metagenome]|uniref:POTRA domain-containing protein n=1 Tax=hydrothermal vent metagenome TaxID=652676 RepID=A0A3B1CF17_9ZZZZ
MARRKSKKKEALKINWRAIGKIVASVVAMVAVTAGSYLGSIESYKYFTACPYFNIDKLSVTGHRQVSEANIMKTIGPVLGHNTFALDITAIGELLKANPWIKDVEVKRILPSTLNIRVIERVPVAIAVISGMWLMDEDAVLLKKISSAAGFNLPKLREIKTGTKKIKAGASIGKDKIKPALDALAWLDDYRLFGLRTIDSVNLKSSDRLKITFKNSETQVIVPRKKWTDEIERLLVVDYLLREKSEKIESIDLTFDNKVIVTRPQA